jgi:hypothetical protein
MARKGPVVKWTTEEDQMVWDYVGEKRVSGVWWGGIKGYLFWDELVAGKLYET